MMLRNFFSSQLSIFDLFWISIMSGSAQAAVEDPNANFWLVIPLYLFGCFFMGFVSALSSRKFAGEKK